MDFFSPLRYPGGKASLAPYLGNVVELNGLSGGTYIEPFAGGAGAALQLLMCEFVGEIILNDIDPNIAAIWSSIVNQTDDFLELLHKTPVSIAAWKRQKQIYKRETRKKNYSQLEIGFAAFYLNRTNRSGVMDAGPIGGQDQTGNYKIGARYNKEGLSRRIERIGIFKDRIKVFNQDAISFLKLISKKSLVNPLKSLAYCDPPYYIKGRDLYEKYFKLDDHKRFAKFVNEQKFRWLISYDDTAPIHELYSHRDRNVLFMNYFVHSAKVERELIISSTNCLLPENSQRIEETITADEVIAACL